MKWEVAEKKETDERNSQGLGQGEKEALKK